MQHPVKAGFLHGNSTKSPAFIGYITLPETYIAPEKMVSQKESN